MRKRYIITALFLILFTAPAFAKTSFEAWVKNFKKDAIRQGISKNIVNQAMHGIKPIPRVIELDRKQPEGTMSFAQYQKRVISNARIAQGRKLYKKHKNLLDRTAQKYGVPPQYIVALWGIETSYGNNTGGFRCCAGISDIGLGWTAKQFFPQRAYKRPENPRRQAHRTKKHERLLGRGHGTKTVYALQLSCFCGRRKR